MEIRTRVGIRTRLALSTPRRDFRLASRRGIGPLENAPLSETRIFFRRRRSRSRTCRNVRRASYRLRNLGLLKRTLHTDRLTHTRQLRNLPAQREAQS